MRNARTALAVSLAVLLAGCSVSEPSPSAAPAQETPYQLPSEFAQHSFVWSAEPGIDLLSEKGVVARAFLESLLVAANRPTKDQAYPGFARITQYLVASEAVADTDNFTDVRGTGFARIVSMRDEGSETKVFLCLDQTHTARRFATKTDYLPGYYQPVEFYMSLDDSLNAVETHDAQTPAHLVAAEQHGPRSAPAGDVFSRWRVVHLAFLNTDDDWREVGYDYNGAVARCKRAASSNPLEQGLPEVKYLGRTSNVDPDDPAFKPLLPSPGWPEPGLS